MKLTLIRATLTVASLFLLSNARGVPPSRVTHTFNGDMTLDQAVQLALKQNPDVLRALQQIELTRGQVIEVRSQGLPHVIVNASYNQEDPGLIQGENSTSITPAQLTGVNGVTESMAQQLASALNTASSSATSSALGNLDKSWIVTVQATQVIYAGNAIQAGNRIAKFTDDSSYFSLRNTVDQTIDTVRQQFYTVLLDRALIKVQEEALRLLGDQLKDQQNRFEAGTVPRFNVLQAEVALENQRPILIAARNAFTVSVITLSRTLGLDPGPQGNPTFNAVGELGVHERPLGLRNAIELGIERRPFLKVQRLAILIQKEQIKVALAGYKPQINANVGYETRNSILTSKLDDTVNGWFFGVTGQWNIFDGFETFGKVKMARASLESARITYEDSVHQVELEVQQAYANLLTARETIRSGQKTVEEANEALRLAKERLAAGAGVQLDVLNAQVQLTTAESTELQARANYNTAMAEFDRVTATDTVYAETFDDPLTHHGKRKAAPAPPADQQDNPKKKNK
jgi:outer membrane protein TolC